MVKNQKLVLFDGMTGSLSEVIGYPTAFNNNGVYFDFAMSKVIHVVYNTLTNQPTPYLVNGNQLANALENGEIYAND